MIGSKVVMGCLKCCHQEILGNFWTLTLQPCHNKTSLFSCRGEENRQRDSMGLRTVYMWFFAWFDIICTFCTFVHLSLVQKRSCDS